MHSTSCWAEALNWWSWWIPPQIRLSRNIFSKESLPWRRHPCQQQLLPKLAWKRLFLLFNMNNTKTDRAIVMITKCAERIRMIMQLHYICSSAAGAGAIWKMNHSIAGFPTSSFAIGTYRIISHHKSHHLSVSASSILTTANVQNGRNGVGWQHSLIYPGYNRVCGFPEYIVYLLSHGAFKRIFVVILCLLLSK